MGKVLLDFGGAWTSNAKVGVKMAMGELTLRLPRRAGVKITMDKFLSSFEPAGLLRHGESFQSPNYDRAQRHLDLRGVHSDGWGSTWSGLTRRLWAG